MNPAFIRLFGNREFHPVDSDAVAFLTAAGITDLTISNAINALVIGLKADGLWSKMIALYPMVGGTAAAHKFNLKDPRDLNAAFRLTWSGTWTHSATGAKPDGSTAYANTHFQPNLYTANAHISYYSRDDTASVNIPIGIYEFAVPQSRLLQLNLNPSGNTILNSEAAQLAAFSGVTSVDAHFIGSRTASNRLDAYRNGVNCATNTNTVSDLRPSIPLYIGARNAKPQSPAPQVPDLWSTLECAGASIGAGLTSAESADFYTHMQTFNTALSRAV